MWGVTGPLGRYVTAATLARLGDGGATVAVVVLTLARTDDAALAGVLVAALEMPYVVTGFFVGAVADRVPQPRRFYAAAFGCYAAAITGVAATVGHTPPAVPVLLALAAGAVGPLLTGGLSGLLPDVVAPDRLGRAYALDTATYHTAGVVAPALVAAVAAVSAGMSMVALAVAVAVGAVVVATLPPRPHRGDPVPLVAGLGKVFAAIWRHRPLRAVTVATTLSHGGTGALPVIAALLAGTLGRSAAAAGVLMSAFGVGAVVGSLAVARWPTRSPLRMVYGCLVVTGVVLGLAAVVPWFGVVVVLFAVAGFCDGPLLTATFLVRGEHAPPELRTQLFTMTASMKIGASACGAALAGLAAGLGAGTLTVVVGASQLVAAFAGYGVAAIRRRTTVRMTI